ncbi:MAG TPA: hypothetical protein VLX56_02220 [Nitrososphaerales archaeon]|nr:hypothetical protein [Nitrososphaerales archaeon]
MIFGPQRRGWPVPFVAALILLPLAPSLGPPAPASHVDLSPHPASMGFSSAQSGAPLAPALNPNYDEQMGMTFTQSQTALTYNVTALAQTDADGYGPAYLINGLSSTGYWYQAGISYHWPSSSGTYDPTFGFSYEVFGTGGKSVFPSNGGAGLVGFSKAVHSGDNVLLSLTFSAGTAQMLAQDWNTGATAKATFSSEGATTFVGTDSNPSNSNGYFSGLMTEWYHVVPFSGNVGKVTYTDSGFALSSAWMWIDEFDTSTPNSPLFINQTQGPVQFTTTDQIFPFASHGITMYGSAHQFITGQINSASSTVTLDSATSDTASPGFVAAYTLAGLQQAASLDAGSPTLIEADPGTQVTLSINATGSSPYERWGFGEAGNSLVTSVTFKAGSNATYAYYHLVQETVSYRVVGGGSLPSSSPPELVYLVPPASASANSSPAQATQALGTSPTVVFAIVGTTASIAGPVSGAAGEQWAPGGGQSWPVDSPDGIPSPIQLYHQFQVSADYLVVGGGTLPTAPEITSESLGSATTSPLSVDQTTYWFDAGSSYSLTGTINGSSLERWVESGSATTGVVDSPEQSVGATYTHQYQVFLGGNDNSAGSVSLPLPPAAGVVPVGSDAPFQTGVWVDAGSTTNVVASSNQGWQFERWVGSGAGAYSGTNSSVYLRFSGPLNESAVFYVQLSISADAKTNVAYSSPSGSGTVHAGSTQVVYVPPSANVTLQATPSLFLYSFGSWQGGPASKPTTSVVVDSPSAVSATSSYSYLVLASMGTLVLGIVAALVSVLARDRRRRADMGPFVSDS